jgi:hypothetical protein
MYQRLNIEIDDNSWYEELDNLIDRGVEELYV